MTFTCKLFTIHTVSTTSLENSFLIRDLEKLEHGANLPVLTKLEPHVYELEEKLGFKSIDIMASSQESTLISYINGWIRSKSPKKKPTWRNLIWLLKDLGEERFTADLEQYLTYVPVPNDQCVFEDDGKKF